MELTTIKSVLDDTALTGTTLTVAGWVRTFRNDRFIALNDGSTIRNLQCVIDQEQVDAATRARFTTSAAVKCTGVIAESKGSGQRVEMQVTAVDVLGDSDAEKYPIQPKKHSLEFLRENAHLRFRTNTYSAIFRIRHQVSFGIHEYFDQLGYNYFHSPIITASDAEGAGEMFQVTTLPIESPPRRRSPDPVNYSIFETVQHRYVASVLGTIESNLEVEGMSQDDWNFIKSGLTTALYTSADKIEEFKLELEGMTTKPDYWVSKKDGWTQMFKRIRERMVSGTGHGWSLEEIENEVRALCREHGYTLARRTTSVGAQLPPEASSFLSLAFYNIFEILNHYPDYSKDFFGREAHLTVSGQLQAELAALALGKVYTFGPTFRAENSNTARHLAEFWMIEPEAAFMDLKGDMDLAEGLCKHLIARVLRNSMDDLQFLDARLKEEEATKPKEQRSELGLIDRLKFVLENPFERITYTDAIEILLRSKPNQKKQFQFPVEWGIDLQSEHERYLVEKHFKKPVIVTGYPGKIKAFYMRTNGPGDFGYSDKGTTVAAMDVLFPGIGEIIGGSQREERLDVLEARMKEMHVPAEELWWYLDTRRFGTVPHAGFGLGLERFVLFVTGMGNIRDVIPFPRTPKSAEF
ncbi:MAG: asparagine--tRNA ligase [Flavobacteriales bacterium]